jgi:hypothetical protein
MGHRMMMMKMMMTRRRRMMMMMMMMIDVLSSLNFGQTKVRFMKMALMRPVVKVPIWWPMPCSGGSITTYRGHEASTT